MHPPLLLFLLLLTPVAKGTIPAPLNVTIVSFNLEHVLHWLPAPGTPLKTRFRVHVLHLSEVSWTPVPWCLKVDAESPLCDVTESFLDSSSFYMARVQAFGSAQRSNWSLSAAFNPILDTVLGPPQVLVFGCGNCLRLHITPPTGRGQHLVSRRLLSDFTCWVRRSGNHAQFSLRISSTEEFVVEHLEPGVEYCVTAVVTVNFNTRAIPSEPQCAHTSPPRTNMVPALVIAMCVVFLLGVLCCGFLHFRRSATSLPQMLLSIPSFLQTPGTATPEPFSLVNVHPKEPIDCPFPWVSLGLNANQEVEDDDHAKEEEGGDGRLVWEASSEPIKDALLYPQRTHEEL
ncbi:hypothetical protein GJAV_G00254640 [Gymnothorax javanicus]|nr:hypothetical protein GJAV_G00254640 [Gymnothorax javanicus]